MEDEVEMEIEHEQAQEQGQVPRPVEGDDILAGYQYLQFQADSDDSKRYLRLRRLKPHYNMVISLPFLRECGAEDRAAEYVEANTPWSRCFNMSHSMHRELTLEVYSTIRVRPRGAGANEILMRLPNADTSKYEIYFRMFGDDIHLSMEEFAVMLGLYTPAEVRLPLYMDSIHQLASNYLRVWWGAISDKPFGENDTKGRVSDIRDPLQRYLHRLIAKSVTGRKEGTEHCNLRDLFFVRCLLTHTHCNLARCFADYFAGYYIRKKTGSLMGGPYVTQLAISLGYGEQVKDLRIPAIDPRPLNKRCCSHIVKSFIGPDGAQIYRLVAGQSARVPYVPVPLVEPAPIAAAEVEVVDEVEDAGWDTDAGVDAHEPPPRHVPRIYRAVRLDAGTDARLQRMEQVQLEVQRVQLEMQRVQLEMQREIQRSTLQTQRQIGWVVSYIGATQRGERYGVPPPPTFDHEASKSGVRRGRGDDVDDDVDVHDAAFTASGFGDMPLL